VTFGATFTGDNCFLVLCCSCTCVLR
jgi:hypothetical protein